MTEFETWRERLAARVEETRRREEAAATDRRDRRRRRAHGMVDRHVGRLARRHRGDASPSVPDASPTGR